MLKTGREKLKRLLLALLLAALCPLFAYSQDAGQGAESTTDITTPGTEEGTDATGLPDERELRFDEEGAAAAEGEEIRPVTDFSIWDFVRMVLILGFVVALIYGLFFLLKRTQGNQREQSGVIEVLATQSLPGNGMVHLVKVGTQIFMLGSSEQSLRLLTEISDKESQDEVELRVAELPQAEGKSFSDLMSAMLGGFGRTSAAETAGATEEARQDKGGRAGTSRQAAERAESTDSPRASSAEQRPSSAEARAEQEVLEYISNQRQRLRRLNS